MIITKEFKFCAGHRLYGYSGPCKNIHGHNYKVQISLNGDELDKLGMIVDFSTIKDRIAPIINALDHALLLNKNDPLTIALQNLTKILTFDANPTAEVIASWLFREADEAGITNATLVSVKLWETETSFIEVDYV